MTGAEPDRPQDAGSADEAGQVPVRDGGTRDDDLCDDGPVIDPRDPLGLGDLGPSDATGTPPPLAAPTPLAAPGQDASGQDPVVLDAPVSDELVPDERGTDERGTDGHGPDEQGEGALGEGAPGTSDAPHLPPATDARTRAADAAAPADAGASAAPPAGATVDDARGGGVGARPPRSGWARLGHAMRPRTTQGQLITAGLCALLGFALVVQVRQTTDTQLGALRQNDLVRLLDETTTRTDELEQESRDLQRERDELLSGSDRQQAALDAARRTAAMQGILTGRLPATGPGVRITLTEPDGEIRPTTLLHVLEELRNAGAEAMELNGQRITASTAVTGVRGAIEVDGTVITSPFRWTVIGDPDTIAPALEIPGGALARVRSDGGRGTVEKADRVDVEAVRELPDPVHATPDTDEG
ncbi:DUF881 domain-containing protein [Cellulomonas sp. zg-ZUI222]|uniref:DUF881 domain-containing protein n=1 Tax=Cellulomonas TaxID=1707 RepID=UPI001A945B25|nr:MULTISPECIES: DUF881 domain-containing protein [Cellulomonas]MBO0900314.1 DUF881 domain-containing protein [Cellulomonas sp. zg-ZUI22]MBO0920772.1 DUF881 domain-containing protein [Cellulomonas wangleii]